MVAITATSMAGPSQRIATPTTLTAADTFAYVRGKRHVLVLWNTTAGAITPNIKGAAAWSPPTPGADVNTGVAGGCAPLVPAGQVVVLNLDEMWAFLSDSAGTINVTGGTGLTAFFLSD